ncbi:MAG: CDP-diacylglycerol--serine O-phosphatidyltransferase [Bradymonadia bacterium]
MRKRFRFDLRKALFILPNLFTLSSIFCGFYAMLLAAQYSTSSDPATLMKACICILFSMVFDSVDGRVARLTKTQSEFGVQMDSLADVVSFGAAPSLLVWYWGLNQFGSTGLFVCFMFCACGTIRLARFNVMASVGAGASDFFLGLPIPAAAGGLVAAIMTTIRLEYKPVQTDQWVLWLVITLSLLMISNVKFRTFKRTKFTPLMVIGLLSLCGALIACALVVDPAIAIVSLMGLYVSSGLLEYLIRWVIREKGEPDEVLDEGVVVEFAHEIERQYAALYDEQEEELID